MYNHFIMCCFKNSLFENRFFKCSFTIIVILTSLLFCRSIYAQSTKDASYYRAKGFQVFPEYGFAIKAPVSLEDVSSIYDGGFALNYAGIQDGDSSGSCFYQIIIDKLPIGYKNYSEREIKSRVKDLLKEQMSSFHMVQQIYFSDYSYVGYVGETSYNGKKQKGVMFYRDGCIYTMTAISNSLLETRFNAFTNAIKFFPKETSVPTNTPGGQRQYIKEAGVYVSAPCTLEQSSEADYDYVYFGASNPEDESTVEAYKIYINLLPKKLSHMISSDREQIKANIKNYAKTKGTCSVETVDLPSILCYSIDYNNQGFNIRECIVLTDSSVLEFIVYSKKNVSSIYHRFIESISTK